MAENLRADGIGFLEKAENKMKWMIFAAAAVLVLAVHLEARKKKGLSWPDYGRELLGFGPQKPGRQGYLDRLRFLAAMLVVLSLIHI